jgi:hypothetical protein
LIVVVGRQQGVKDVNSVLARTGVNAFAATDINLSGSIAQLAKPGVISGTVH